jgi:Ran GTPase-activating protein (RanGAP) involved in mRNA processing and transport
MLPKEIRELLSEPSMDSWIDLCFLLEEMDLKANQWRELEEALDKNFDDDMREIPLHWLEEVLDGERKPPWWKLCRSLDLSEIDLDPESIVLLSQGDTLKKLAVLSLAQSSLDIADIRILLNGASAQSLRALDLSGCALGVEGARLLASLPIFSNLRELVLDGCELGEEGLRALVDSSAFPALDLLDLGNNELSANALRLLGRPSALSSLRSLALDHNPFGDEGIHILLDLPIFSGLTDLNLDSCALSHEGIALLSKSTRSRDIQELCLAANPLGDLGFQALCKGDAFPALSHLELQECEISGAALRHLGDAAWLGQLAYLDLSQNPLGDGGAKHLATHFSSTSPLSFLALESCDLQAEGISVLAKSGVLSSCEDIDLSGNAIGTAGAKALAEIEEADVETLYLRGVSLGDDGLKALLASPFLANVMTLDLGENGFTAQAAHHLANANFLPNLADLNLDGNRGFGDKGLSVLARAALMEEMGALSLSGCGIGEAGFLALTKAKSLEHLYFLDISNNDLNEKNRALLRHAPVLAHLLESDGLVFDDEESEN